MIQYVYSGSWLYNAFTCRVCSYNPYQPLVKADNMSFRIIKII